MCVAPPFRIVELDGNTAVVELGGSRSTARVDAIEDPQVGDYVRVHAGLAITKLDPDKAREDLVLFRELGML